MNNQSIKYIFKILFENNTQGVKQKIPMFSYVYKLMEKAQKIHQCSLMCRFIFFKRKHKSENVHS